MQLRTAIAVVLAASCGGTASQIDWGDAGVGAVNQSEAGAASSSSSGQSSGMAVGAAGSGGTTGNGSSGSGSPQGSASGNSAPTAASGSSGSGAGTSPSSSADAATVDATGGNNPPAIEAGAVDSASQGAGDGGDPLAAARAQCVQIINQYRSTLNPPSPPLQEATAQESCVDGQAKADYTANTAHSAFGVCRERAQDECPNWPGPPSAIMTKCLAQMWAEGPPPPGTDNHWLNMSNAKYTRVACGFFQTPRGGWWATQDFW